MGKNIKKKEGNKHVDIGYLYALHHPPGLRNFDAAGTLKHKLRKALLFTIFQQCKLKKNELGAS